MVSPALHIRSDARPGGYRDIAPQDVLPHLGELRVIDVREPDEWRSASGHLASAELVPLATVPAVAVGWDRRQPLLLVCRSGGRSARAAGVLSQMGFETLYNLVGGMLAWEANDLPRVVEGARGRA